jgi:hypothetical protein
MLRFAIILTSLVAASSALSAENWPQWRGPALNGLSAEKNLPVRWSPTENITWKLGFRRGPDRRQSSGAIGSSSTVAEDLRQR